MKKNKIYYKNDFKYVKYKNELLCNTEQIEDEDNIRKKLGIYNINLDSIEYRIKEYNEGDKLSLDLNNMELNELPKNIPTGILYLYCSGNKLKNIDLIKFKKLIVLDISNNLINNITNIPITIEEIVCSNNKLDDINIFSNLPNLIRLDCSNNNIKSIPLIPKLSILYCDNNKINKIEKYNYLTKLSCSHNLIKNIYSKNIQKLVCSNNLIKKINNYYNLKYLDCSHNNISYISNLPNIIEISCQDNNIKYIDHFKKLTELKCDYNNDIAISNKYIIEETTIFGKNNDNILFIFKQMIN